MLNKDNLENGLQHSAASVTPLLPRTHTLLPHLPKAALLMFVLILLPESGWGEGCVGGALKGAWWLCWRTLMAIIKTKLDQRQSN